MNSNSPVFAKGHIIEFNGSRHNSKKKLEDELNERIKDHEITYRELYEVMGVYHPGMEYIDEYGKLDKIAIHNPELNNGAYI